MGELEMDSAVAAPGKAGRPATFDALQDDGKHTKASQISTTLRDAIIDGYLEQGSKINLHRVRKEFGVSLTPLREALARLIPDGLVRFEDNRGYSVTPMSEDNLREVTQLRVEFETFALAEACRRGDESWRPDVIASLHRLNKCKRDASKPETLAEWEILHQDFHLALISGCGMTLLTEFCKKLMNLNDRYRRAFLNATSGDPRVAQEHNEIAAAAVSGDADYACQLLREHIQRTGQNLHQHLLERTASS